MHNQVILKSSSSDATLTFYALEVDYFSVKLESRSHSGIIRVYSFHEIESLLSLFKSLSADWQGWPGEKSWKSLEDELSIVVTNDNLGHIYFRVILKGDIGDDEPWQLDSIVTIDSGQLERLYSDMKQFLIKL